MLGAFSRVRGDAVRGSGLSGQATTNQAEEGPAALRPAWKAISSWDLIMLNGKTIPPVRVYLRSCSDPLTGAVSR